MIMAILFILFLQFTFVLGEPSGTHVNRITSSTKILNSTEIIVSSSFFDITLQPTFTSLDRSTLGIVQDATQSFLSGSLSTAFGSDEGPRFRHMAVKFHDMTFTMDNLNRRVQETETSLQPKEDHDVALQEHSSHQASSQSKHAMREIQSNDEIYPSTTITFSIEARFYVEAENDPDFAEYIETLILASFGTISGINKFRELMSISGNQILKEVDEIVVVPTYLPFPIDGHSSAKSALDQSTSEKEEFPSEQNSGSTSSIWKGSVSPVDILFVVISGLILAAVVFVIWNENRKRNVSHEDRLGYFPSSRLQSAPSIVITSNEAPQISFRTVPADHAKLPPNGKSEKSDFDAPPPCDVGFHNTGAIHSPPLRRHFNSLLRYKKLPRVVKSDKNSLTSEESSGEDKREDDNSGLGSIPENKELPSDFRSKLVIDKSEDSDDVFQIGSVDSPNSTDKSAASWHEWTRGVRVEYSKSFKSNSTSTTRSCMSV